MLDHAENLKSLIHDAPAYAAALDALTASAPRRQAIAALVKELTGIAPRPDATLKGMFRTLERFGQAERRHEARAEVSPRVMPA
jgi:hypothetical protein